MIRNPKRFAAISLVLVLIILTVSSIAIQAAPGVNVKLAVFSDPHYIAPQYVSQGTAFNKYLAQDRKLLAESYAIVGKTVESIQKTDAQIVLITGDLTKDGEKLSHIQFTAYLKQLKDSGKQVLVVPGNHDINNPDAVQYQGDNAVPVDCIAPDDFRTIYHDYGYGDAIAQDPNSLSYVAEPVPGLWIIAIDSCSYDGNIAKGTPATSSGFTTKRLDWIRTQLQKGKAENKLVIGMMHHGLIPHFSMEKELFGEYVIDDWENISSEFADLGMKAVFTGHFHAQDIVEKQNTNHHGIYDIETGSLVTYPCPYRIINLTNKKMDIRTETIQDIDYDTKGKPFPQYAADFLTNGLSEMVPWFLASLLVEQGMPVKDAQTAANQLAATKLTPSCTVQDLAAEALKAHFMGDEELNAALSGIISSLQASSDSKTKMLGNIADSLLNDPTPDNNVTLSL